MLGSPGRESRKNGLHVGRGEIARASVAIGLPNIPDHYWNGALETGDGAGTSLGSRPPGFPSGPRGAPQDAILSSAKGRGLRVVSPFPTGRRPVNTRL